ncbi:hypothetical protein X975_23135, partial [Stegodyphus mimosarum]
MSDLLSLRTETETLKRSFEASEGERIALIEKIQQLQAELIQFKELKLRNVNDDEQIVSLQKDLSIKAKAERKLKKEIAMCHEQLSVKTRCLSQLKKSNKKFANLLLNFGEKMQKAELLTVKEKKFLHALSKDCQDQNSDFSLSLAENSNGLEMNQTSLDSPVDFIQKTERDDAFGQNNVSDIGNIPSAFSPHSQISETLHTNISNSDSNRVTISASENCPSLEIRRACNDSAQEKSKNAACSVLQCVSDAHVQSEIQPKCSTPVKFAAGSPFVSKLKPSTGNYFLQSCKSIVEDPYVSDDCLDISVSELNSLKQQVCMQTEHLAPLSPLPPTPPPKHASLKRLGKLEQNLSSHNLNLQHNSHNLSHSLMNGNSLILSPSYLNGQKLSKDHASVNSAKRRNLCHQQSEGFDIQNDSSFEQSNTYLQSLSTATPNSESSKTNLNESSLCRLSCKRSINGDLKIGFNVSKAIDLEVDASNMNVYWTLKFNDLEENPSNAVHAVNQSFQTSMPNHQTRYSNSEVTVESEVIKTSDRKRPRIESDQISNVHDRKKASENSSEMFIHNNNSVAETSNAVMGIFKTESPGHTLPNNNIDQVDYDTCNSVGLWYNPVDQKHMMNHISDFPELQQSTVVKKELSASRKYGSPAKHAENNTSAVSSSCESPSPIKRKLKFGSPINSSIQIQNHLTPTETQNSLMGKELQKCRRMGSIENVKIGKVNVCATQNQNHMLPTENSGASVDKNLIRRGLHQEVEKSNSSIIQNQNPLLNTEVPNESKHLKRKQRKNLHKSKKTKESNLSVSKVKNDSKIRDPLKSKLSKLKKIHKTKGSQNKAKEKKSISDNNLLINATNILPNEQVMQTNLINVKTEKPILMPPFKLSESSSLDDHQYYKKNSEQLEGMRNDKNACNELSIIVKENKASQSFKLERKLSANSRKHLFKQANLTAVKEEEPFLYTVPLKQETQTLISATKDIKKAINTSSGKNEVLQTEMLPPNFSSQNKESRKGKNKKQKLGSKKLIKPVIFVPATSVSSSKNSQENPETNGSSETESLHENLVTDGSSEKESSDAQVCETALFEAKSQNIEFICCPSSTEMHHANDIGAENKNNNILLEKDRKDPAVTYDSCNNVAKANASSEVQSDIVLVDGNQVMSAIEHQNMSDDIKHKREHLVSDEQSFVSEIDKCENVVFNFTSINSKRGNGEPLLSKTKIDAPNENFQNGTMLSDYSSFLPEAVQKINTVSNESEDNTAQKSSLPLKFDARNVPSNEKSIENGFEEQRISIFHNHDEHTLSENLVNGNHDSKEYVSNESISEVKEHSITALKYEKVANYIETGCKNSSFDESANIKECQEESKAEHKKIGNRNLNELSSESTDTEECLEDKLIKHKKPEIGITNELCADNAPIKVAHFNGNAFTRKKLGSPLLKIIRCDDILPNASNLNKSEKTKISESDSASDYKVINSYFPKASTLSAISPADQRTGASEAHLNGANEQIVENGVENIICNVKQEVNNISDTFYSSKEVKDIVSVTNMQKPVAVNTKSPSTNGVNISDMVINTSISDAFCNEMSSFQAKAKSKLTVNDTENKNCNGHAKLNDVTLKKLNITLKDKRSSRCSDSDMNSDSDALVIAEDSDDEKCTDIATAIESSNEDSEPVSPNESKQNKKRKTSKVTRKAKKKGKKKANVKNKRKIKVKTEVQEQKHPLTAVLENIEKLKFDATHAKHELHTFKNTLINPLNAPHCRTLLYHILNHLLTSRRNPLMSYTTKPNVNVLLPFVENSIVNSLFEIEHKKKPHLHGLLSSALKTIPELVLSNDRFSIYGLSSICRVYTEICKHKNDTKAPLILCADLLKRRHKFAPFLIASIVGVWREIFEISESANEEEANFHSSITYAIQKKSHLLSSAQWLYSRNVIDDFLKAPPVSDVNVAADFCIQALQSKCT